MRLLIKRALILDPQSPFHRKRVDVYLKKGVIAKIGRNLNDRADQIVQSGNLHVSPGFFDLGAQCGEPGYEHRESLETLSTAALTGGYSGVACFPNTQPVLHSKSEIEFIRNKSQALPISVHPIGAVSTDCAGADLAELYDMRAAGAIAFSDGRNALTHPGLMLRALHYVRGFNGLIINRPDQYQIAPGGQIHESETSISLGLKGIPSLREHVMLERDIRLLEYAGSRLHVFGVSTSEGLSLIRQAKRNKLNITASVPAANLLFEDEDLIGFNTNMKVQPPFRSKTDRRALLRAIKDGAIDCIVSNHEPVEEERKKMEFAYADFGSTGLETAFSIALTACRDLVPLEKVVACFTTQPRAVLGIRQTGIMEGEDAEITLFDPDISWQVTGKDLTSRSRNSAALGTTLTGAVLGTITKQTVHLTPEK